MGKHVEIFRSHENSDGVWRGYGKPIFKGSKGDAQQWVYDNAQNYRWPNDSLELVMVTIKKGVETKRELVKNFTDLAA